MVTDSAVAPLYGQLVLGKVNEVAPAKLFTVAAGEWNKTRGTWIDLTDQLLADRYGRDSAIIALGGGVVGDLAGFTAATYLRGISYVQVPTTLLAMIDSSIGGKTGVDTSHGKNLVGSFHQPRAVITDVATLETLPPIQFSAGMAEAIKHGAIADEAYFDSLLDGVDRILAKDHMALMDVVRRSVEIKAGIVTEDEREQGRRATLNFGHTIGHALEATLGYEVLHGEAVAIGMLAESKLGVMEGITDTAVVDRISYALECYNLPLEPPSTVPTAELRETIVQDKKSRDGTVRFALLERVGSPARGTSGEWTIPVSEEHLSTLLTEFSG